MNRFFGFFISIILFFTLSCAGGGTTQQTNTTNSTASQAAQAPANQNWTGDGGKGMSIAILAPKATGLEENQKYLPALVQGEFVSNFSGFSAMSVMDRENMDDVYAELLSGYYSDDDAAGLDLGHLTSTDYLMTGNITRTATGYALQMQVTNTADKMTTASYSGTCTFAELDNLTGIRIASLDLLQKMGITLTAKAQTELTAAAMSNHVNAQTALARGITAQQQGTEVAALSYYFQASTYDPSLLEAANRSSILNANISSGNIGDDVRNDIAWRRDWVARLTETEQYFDTFNKTESMPYTLFYSEEIQQGTVNYQNETVTLSIVTHLHGSGIWTVSIERALQAVYDGLDATKRKDTWGLGSWPRQGVTNLNAFARRSNNFSVVFELLNDQNKVIGRQTLQSGGSWELNWGGRPVANVSADDRKTLSFQNVNANDISTRMTIRIATVNGTNAETAARNGVLQIRSLSKDEFEANIALSSGFSFEKGEVRGVDNKILESSIKTLPNGNNHISLDIPSAIWGDPVISIGDGAFSGRRLNNVTIPNGVIFIGTNAFSNNELREVIIPASVRTIGDGAFKGNKIGTVEKPQYSNWPVGEITIGANVTMVGNPLDYETLLPDGRMIGYRGAFLDVYNNNGKIAGRYLLCISNNTLVWVLQGFTSDYIGTWKKSNTTDTVTITTDTIKFSSQPAVWFYVRNGGESHRISSYSDIPDVKNYGTTYLKLLKNGNLEISGTVIRVDGKGDYAQERKLNGTWVKQ